MKELQALSLKELTAIYNKHADKPIKLFSCSKVEAVKRTFAVMPAPQAETKAPKKEGTKPQGIGRFIMEQLTTGTKVADIVTAVAAKFPDANTKVASVYWYKSAMKSGRVSV